MDGIEKKTPSGRFLKFHLVFSVCQFLGKSALQISSIVITPVCMCKCACSCYFLRKSICHVAKILKKNRLYRFEHFQLNGISPVFTTPWPWPSCLKSNIWYFISFTNISQKVRDRANVSHQTGRQVDRANVSHQTGRQVDRANVSHQTRRQVFAIEWRHCEFCTSMILTYILTLTNFEMWISRKWWELAKNAQVGLRLYRLIFAIEWDHCECCTRSHWASNILLLFVCYKKNCTGNECPRQNCLDTHEPAVELLLLGVPFRML